MVYLILEKKILVTSLVLETVKPKLLKHTINKNTLRKCLTKLAMGINFMCTYKSTDDSLRTQIKDKENPSEIGRSYNQTYFFFVSAPQKTQQYLQ